jgi:small subunit ribosomal protein S11
MLNKEKKSGCIIIRETKNNIFINLNGVDGKLLVTYSGGSLGFKGSNRGTSFASKLIGRRVGKDAHFFGVKTIILKVKGPINQLVKSAIQGLLSFDLEILQIEQVKGPAHNGVRLCKKRRL